jgi:hypothetical protein
MKIIPKKILIIAFAAIPILGIYIGFKWTHGLVFLDIYARKFSQFDADAGNGIGVEVKVGESIGFGESKDEGPLGLYLGAELGASKVIVNVVSKEPLLSVRVDTTTVRDDRGENTPETLQNVSMLPLYRNRKDTFSFPDYGWYGISVKGYTEISISGKAVMEEENREIPFHVTIPIECLSVRTVITRKKWDSFLNHHIPNM